VVIFAGPRQAGLRLEADELDRRARRIGLVLTDCDGVLTDTGVYYSAEGEELKRFSIRDGMGVERLRNAGIRAAIVTGERSHCVTRRADKLQIQAYLGVKDKVGLLETILTEHDTPVARVAYIGDDVNDLGIMNAIAEAGGLCATPGDGMPEVAEAAHYVTAAPAGHGAFRDFAEWILRLRPSANAETRDFG